jgi:hypothetical protein
MPRINQLSQISDKKGLMLANELELKSPNGKMFVKKEVMESDAFIQKVIKKDVEIINSAIPTRNKVVPVGTEGAMVTADNSEAFIKVPITELTDKDSYWTDKGLMEKNFTVDEKFLSSMTVTQLKAWATKRGIKLTETVKAKIIAQIIENI